MSRPLWRPPRRRPWLRWVAILGGLGYLAAALGSLNLDPARLSEGWGRGGRFLLAFLRPDFSGHLADIRDGFLESLTMTAVATVMGVLLAVPAALGAARNIAPRPVYWLSRGGIAVARSFQEIVVAILFVVMVGFGPLAGVLTLVVATVGFVGKLLAEEIEALDHRQVEAVRASGASGPQVLVFGVLPQVLPRFVGLAVYRLDINFRESVVIGVVGAGGIGATLNTAFSRYEFDTAAAILILIISLVLIGELVSGRLRRGMV